VVVQFNLVCPNCGKDREYATKKSLERASSLKSSCASCRTVNNNRKRKGTKSKEQNPAWKGYKDVPGKVLSKLKRGALHRGLVFEITIEDIQEVYEEQHKLCAFSGLPLIFGVDASVDRLDSQEGYTRGNIQIVHKQLNMIKRDTPNEQFIEWCCLVANHTKE
jgi:uncharacterized Zn finger protein (UPF0148 family)